MSRAEILATVKDDDFRGYLAGKIDAGFAVSGRVHAQVYTSTVLPADPIHAYTYCYTVLNKKTGATEFRTNENGVWLDIFRTTYRPEIDSVTLLEMITRFASWGMPTVMHTFSPAYGAYGDIDFCTYVYNSVKANISALPPVVGDDAERAIRAGQIDDYDKFADLVMRGYSALDFAISTGKNDSAKSMLDMTITSDGHAIIPLYSTNSKYLPKDVKTDSLPVTLANYRLGRCEVHTKFGIAVTAKNWEIAKFILGKGYRLGSIDYSDLISDGPASAQSFLDAMREGDGLSGEIFDPVFTTLIGLFPDLH